MKKAKHTGKEITIIGVVEDNEESDGSGVIVATDDDDYVVEVNKQGKRLAQEVDMDVEVTGFVTKNGDGTKRITVTDFEVLESDDEGDEDEMYYGDGDETYDDNDDTKRWL
jgi:hypothetical protein